MTAVMIDFYVQYGWVLPVFCWASVWMFNLCWLSCCFGFGGFLLSCTFSLGNKTNYLPKKLIIAITTTRLKRERGIPINRKII